MLLTMLIWDLFFSSDHFDMVFICGVANVFVAFYLYHAHPHLPEPQTVDGLALPFKKVSQSVIL
jgi:hypothetical protein